MKTFNIKALAVFVAMGLFSNALVACQLALPDDHFGEHGDQLVGLFLSTHSVREVNNDPSRARDFPSRVDGVLIGGRHNRQEWAFPDVEGMFLLFPIMSPNNPDGSKDFDRGVYYSAEFQDRKMGVFGGWSPDRGGGELTIEGTLFVSAAFKDTVLTFRPIYQSRDGEVYILPDFGRDDLTQLWGEFFCGHLGASSQYVTFDNSSDLTGMGEKSDLTSVSISVNIQWAPGIPHSVSIIEMSDQYKVLARQTYQPGQVPKSVSVTRQTAYLIVETEVDPSSESFSGTQRQVYDPVDSYFVTLTCRSSGICPMRHTSINWH